MLSVDNMLGGVLGPAQLVPDGTRAEVFQRIYEVFLLLGTVVGVVVITYMCYKAYKYRESAEKGAEEGRPELGELPSGGGGGRKLFLSFTLSAIIVLSLISWTYFTLLYVENPGPTGEEEPMTVEVIGHQFYWEFVYPNGHSTQGELVIPEDRRIRLEVTASDVFHNFGVPELRAKADAIPGQETDTWLIAEDTGTYQANCYELCGVGHSHMTGTVRVVSADEFETWYANTTNETENASTNGSANESVIAASTLEGADAGRLTQAAPARSDARIAAGTARTGVAMPRAAVAATADGGERA